MTADDFRRIALALPETEEQEHMAHPDFRVGGKIFATLLPDGLTGMVKLPPHAQTDLLAGSAPGFRPASGAWGRGGATLVALATADGDLVRETLRTAYRGVASRRLAARLDELT